MAVRGLSSAAVRMPAGSQVTEVTLPPGALCHYITDDELDRLSEMRKEPVMEIFLCTIGAFLGALVPAFQVLSQFRADPTKVDMWGLLTLMIGVAMFAIAAVSGFLWYQRGKAHVSMTDAIRNRPRVQVQHA